ncbi:MAG TPA: Holliday junction branch migration protein RuvA [Oscillospiraceae bacterium]|nr:Holliday junction branch migration protein RuvA [Oscillospiraceae bacterium]
MFNYLRGTLIDKEKETIVLENSGIGWQITVPLTVQAQLASVGQEIKLYTYLAVREDALQLYGFSQREELTLFKLLISVSGVGPKAALAVLSTLSAGEFYWAIMHENIKALTRVPGIGPKSARRLIVELKEKATNIAMSRGEAQHPAAGQAAVAMDAYSEALAALLSLGYQGTEAQSALNEVPEREQLATEELLRKALAYLGTH